MKILSTGDIVVQKKSWRIFKILMAIENFFSPKNWKDGSLGLAFGPTLTYERKLIFPQIMNPLSVAIFGFFGARHPADCKLGSVLIQQDDFSGWPAVVYSSSGGTCNNLLGLKIF